MMCPTIDKLTQYVDDLLTGQELVGVRNHIECCAECQEVVSTLRGEEQFIKETLETPTLPDDFANIVLEQLEPYEQRKKRRPWKRVMLAAAGLTLAVGITATFNPGFAALVGGLFTTEQVDEGLREAANAGLVDRVNFEVTDRGLTFKVEDILADSSRIALSYKILNNKGEVKKVHQGIGDLEEIWVTDQSGKLLDDVSISDRSFDEEGKLEFSLREQTELAGVIIHFKMNELNGKKGNWTLHIPIELKKNNELTIRHQLDEEKSIEGIDVHLKEIQWAPSSSNLYYETSYSEEERKSIEDYIQKVDEKYGKEIDTDFMFGSGVNFHIENKNKEIIFRNSSIFTGTKESDYEGYLKETGTALAPIGHMEKISSFNPQKEDELTLVLDGVIKTIPADFSVTVKPKELKKQPISFEYEGNSMEIKSIEKESDYHLRRSLLPIGKRTTILIKLEGEKEAYAPEFGTWILVDDKGKAYTVFDSGSNFERTFYIYGMDKIPEEFTLHLLTMTRYEELKEKWEVPLRR